MKSIKIFLIILSTFFSFTVFSQKIGGVKDLQSLVIYQINENQATSEFDCTFDYNYYCNIISNNKFISPNPNATNPLDPQAYYPFNNNFVPRWAASSGSPNLFDIFTYNNNGIIRPAPFSGIGYSFLTGASTITQPEAIEGIVQKIVPLQKNHKYILSFYKAFSNYNDHIPKFAFKIKLFYCELNNPLPNPNTHIIEPQLQGNIQQVYCENNPQNEDWQQSVVKFSVRREFDAITITPSITELGTNDNSYGGGISFAYPELIDLTNFNAGTASAPNQDCKVTIGPDEPNWGVKNAIFRWLGPNGQVVTAPNNQQIQVDASNPSNVGTWTLTMTVPSAIATNNTCSENNPVVSASVQVNAFNCNFGSWPKGYPTKPAYRLIKTSTNDILLSAVFCNLQNPILNHQGYFPSIGECDFNLQYSTNGISNWGSSNHISNETTNGVIQSYSYNNSNQIVFSYLNSNNGSIVSPNLTIPTNHFFLANLNNTDILTSSFIQFPPSYDIPYYSTLFLNPNSPNVNNEIVINNTATIKINTIFQRIYIYENNTLKIYSYTNNTLSLINSYPNIIGDLVQVTDNNEVFFVISNELKKLNFSTSPVSFNLVSSSGFINSDIGMNSTNRFISDNLFTENRVLVQNTANFRIYSVDLSNPNNFLTKSINLSSLSPSYYYQRYLYSNNDVYITYYKQSNDNNFLIGNQTLPSSMSGSDLMIFTKLSIDNDFSFKNNNQQISYLRNSAYEKNQNIQVIASPNPANQIVRFNIDSKLSGKNNIKYTLAVKDRFSNSMKVIKNYINNSEIDISSLNRGLYIIEITDNLDNQTISKFIKN